MKKIYTAIIICLLPICSFAADTHNSTEPFKFDIKTEKAFSRKPEIITIKNGQPIINANNGFANVTLARIGKDGKIESFCTSEIKQAEKFLRGEDLSIVKGEIK